MSNKKIILTGVTGQISSYMVDYILANTDLDIIGTVRRLSVENHTNIAHVKGNPRFRLVEMDLSDAHSITSLIETEKPDYFINFAANSFVGTSWTYPIQHFECNALGVLHQLEAIRKYSPKTRYVNLGSSEEFGDVIYSPQDEKHPSRPRSPYGASKAAARNIVKVWRDSYNLYALQVWNFNTESERRGCEFLPKKITQGVARIYHAIKQNQSFEPISIGNVNSKRDWQHCEDVCSALWVILHQEQYRNDMNGFEHNGCGRWVEGFDNWISKQSHPETIRLAREFLAKNIKEYVISSGEVHTIKELIDLAFKEAGVEGYWTYNGKPEIPENEVYGNIVPDGHNQKFVKYIKIDPKFYRPADVLNLQGCSDAIKHDLNWKPEISFEELVKRMVRWDIENYE